MARRKKARRVVWHKDPAERAICPKCGEVGSGLYSKWVLNERKKRYEPYYYFAHPINKKGRKGIQWHYIRKKRALEILASKALRAKYQLEEIKEAERK